MPTATSSRPTDRGPAELIASVCRDLRSTGWIGLEEAQHGEYPPVDVGLLGHAELAEQCVGALLHRPLADMQGTGDRDVVLAGRHLAQDGELPLGERGQ